MLKRDIEGLKNDEAAYWIFEPVINSVLTFIEKVEKINSVNPEAVTLDNMFNIINENPIIMDEINEFENEADEFNDGVEDEVNREMKIIDKLLAERRVANEFVGVLDDTDYYIKDDTSDTTEIEEMAGKVLSIITSIGMVLAVLMSAILGIKYMIGSVEQKAEYKKDMVPYLVGAFLLFGICTVVKILQQFGQAINKIQ